MRIRSNWVLAALLGGCFLAAPAAGHAALLGPTPYLSFADSPFNGGSFSSFFLEDFEDGFLNTPGVAGTGGIVLGPSPLTDSVDADDGAVDGSGTGGHSYFSNGASSTFTFTFDPIALGGLPTHAGIVWTDVGQTLTGTPGIGQVTFEAFDAANVSLGSIGPSNLGDGVATGGTAEDRFFGATNPGGISSIRLTTSNSTDWEADHLQYGIAATQAVPEPGTLALFTLGAVAWVLARRRRT